LKLIAYNDTRRFHAYRYEQREREREREREKKRGEKKRQNRERKREREREREREGEIWICTICTATVHDLASRAFSIRKKRVPQVLLIHNIERDKYAINDFSIIIFLHMDRSTISRRV